MPMAMTDELNAPESAYNADMSSVNSSPCMSPVIRRKTLGQRSASDFDLPGERGLTDRVSISPSPHPLGKSMSSTHIGATQRGCIPHLSRQPFSIADGSLARSQSLQSLYTEWSLRPISRQGSENDLRRLAVQNLISQPNCSSQGPAETCGSRQISKDTGGNFIEFAAQYDSRNARLVVNVKKCFCSKFSKGKGSKKELTHIPSLFATVCLLPDYHVKYQTRIHYEDSHPQFNEQFIFNDVTLPALAERHIFLAVYNHEGKSQKIVGCCDVPLRQVSATGSLKTFHEELQSTKKSRLVSKTEYTDTPVVACVCLSMPIVLVRDFFGFSISFLDTF